MSAEATVLALTDAYDSGKFAEAWHPALELGVWRARNTRRYASALETGTGTRGGARRIIQARAGRVFRFSTTIPAPGVQGRSARGVSRGPARRLRLTEHEGIVARHVGERAAKAIAAASPRLRYRARRDWWQGG